MQQKFITLFITALLLAGCTSKTRTHDSQCLQTSANIKYAKGFDIRHSEHYTQLTVYNPWKPGAVQQRIYLVNDSATETPSDGIRITIPVHSVAISSCTHTEPLQLIGEIESVSAACSPELIYNRCLAERIASGEVISLGNAFSVNIERLLAVHPDIYIVASYNQQDENANRLTNAGAPVVYNNEWTETSLLGRAEWIKYIAAFFGKENLADSIFNTVEQNYTDTKKLTAAIADKPTVMAGSNYKGTWYLPGGKSYMGQLFSDAGADYYYANDTTTSSLPLNFETVLHKFNDADVWLNAPVSSINELLSMDERHAFFRSAREGNVFAFTARTHPSGANDFWESAVSRPDIILKDMIWALHPELLPDYTPVYIMKLR
ncbi:MAG: ABC transporter substrate-binding protein [Candidatus Aphodosoma sp.]